MTINSGLDVAAVAVDEGRRRQHVLQEPEVLRHEVLHLERRGRRRGGGGGCGGGRARDGAHRTAHALGRREAYRRRHGVVVVGAAGRQEAQHVDDAAADTRPPERRAHLRQRREGAAEVVAAGVVVVVQLRGEEVGAAAERGRDGVRVLALVRGDHHRRILVRPLHPLLHRALLRRAPVVAPAPVAHARTTIRSTTISTAYPSFMYKQVQTVDETPSKCA